MQASSICQAGRPGRTGLLMVRRRCWTVSCSWPYRPGMSILATIMNTATGRPIQKMTFGRMPKPWASFNLATGELVTAERIDIGKPAPGKFITPVDVWVTIKPAE